MADLPQVDRVLRDAVERGDVPGVVAMAATAEGQIYAGAAVGGILLVSERHSD